MNYTEKHHLPQWEEKDRIMMNDFNQAMANIESGIAGVQGRLKSEIARMETAIGTGGTTARVVYGTYTGNGKYGKATPTTLDFAKTLGCRPKLLIVMDQEYSFYALLLMPGTTEQPSYHASYTRDSECYITWTETGVSWYNEKSANYQLNNNQNYQYIAIA